MKVDPDVPPHIAQWVDRFYKITDASDHDAYLAQFEPDASFNVLAPRAGHAAIRAGREWSFANRGADQVHRWFHIWCPELNVAYVIGDNDFTRKDGVFVNVPFIARMTFNGAQGLDGLKMTDYYVWVVGAGAGGLTVALPAGGGLCGFAGGEVRVAKWDGGRRGRRL
jgi:hypothetical protein